MLNKLQKSVDIYQAYVVVVVAKAELLALYKIIQTSPFAKTKVSIFLQQA